MLTAAACGRAPQMDCFCQNGIDKVVGSCIPDGAASNGRFECPLDQVFQVRIAHYLRAMQTRNPYDLVLAHRPFFAGALRMI